MPPWVPDEDNPGWKKRVDSIEPPRSAQPSGTTCTAAERAYLDAMLDGGDNRRRDLSELRTRIAAERLDPAKKATLLRAWADMIASRTHWEAQLDGVDLGGHMAPLYEHLQREAEALAESEQKARELLRKGVL